MRTNGRIADFALIRGNVVVLMAVVEARKLAEAEMDTFREAIALRAAQRAEKQKAAANENDQGHGNGGDKPPAE
ncbi:MAG TPA: hypothetical protein VIL30_05980 [Ramlibacter sp.]|jgi:hypothetical protein